MKILVNFSHFQKTKAKIDNFKINVHIYMINLINHVPHGTSTFIPR